MFCQVTAAKLSSTPTARVSTTANQTQGQAGPSGTAPMSRAPGFSGRAVWREKDPSATIACKPATGRSSVPSLRPCASDTGPARGSIRSSLPPTPSMSSKAAPRGLSSGLGTAGRPREPGPPKSRTGICGRRFSARSSDSRATGWTASSGESQESGIPSLTLVRRRLLPRQTYPIGGGSYSDCASRSSRPGMAIQNVRLFSSYSPGDIWSIHGQSR